MKSSTLIVIAVLALLVQCSLVGISVYRVMDHVCICPCPQQGD